MICPVVHAKLAEITEEVSKMIKLGNRRWLIVLVACGLVVSACGNDKDDGKDANALTADDSILRFIPANSPYVFANVTPLPDSLYDKFEPKMDAMLKAYQVVIREAMKSKASFHSFRGIPA